MRKFTLFFVLMCCIFGASAQVNKSWKGYFSYRQIRDLSEGQGKLTVAAENALFIRNTTNGSVKTVNSIDGLSGLTISAIYHSDTYKKTLVGYETGLMMVVNEVDGSILTVVDILNKQLPPDIKKINHIQEYNGIAYLSCDFGVVQYNLATLVFGDTYFIGNGGAQIKVNQTAVFQGSIYAATQDFGMRVANINNPFLNDFNQWTTLDANGWRGVTAFGNELMSISTSGQMHRFSGGNFVPFASFAPAVDFRHYGNYLIVTTAANVYVYGSNLAQLRNVTAAELGQTNAVLTRATVLADQLYIGTNEDGVFSAALLGGTFKDVTPPGPLRNRTFSILSTPNNLWVAFGGYNQSFNPYAYEGFTLPKFGLSKFSNGQWLEIPFEDLYQAEALVRITPNPNNENQVYVSSFHKGLIKIENNAPVIQYTPANSSLQAYNNETLRVDGTAFDNSGNLWVANSMQESALKVLRANGQWASYSLAGSFAIAGRVYIGRIAVDRNGTKWLPTRDDGLIAYNENNNPKIKTLRNTTDTGNLPSINPTVVAIDHRNQLWIGTTRGLRVLSSVDSFLTDQQPNADAIIILEDNLAQELLYEQNVRDIVVDGANNKWIATSDSGVFLVSPNGQQTLYHFTVDNSPLPTNAVNDIDINGATGEVFFGTEKGIVSFKGTATDASDNLNNVYVYPNPVRPGYAGTVKVSGLMDKANVKIADIEGNLVYEAIAEGGTIEWDTTAFGKYKVASGVYMVFVSAEDGAETKVKKVMIVR